MIQCPLFLSCYHICLTAGMQVPIVEGQPTTIEIPKGNSDLGLSVSWAEREVNSIYTD